MFPHHQGGQGQLPTHWQPPTSQQPANGAYPPPGHVSLRGHDPRRPPARVEPYVAAQLADMSSQSRWAPRSHHRRRKNRDPTWLVANILSTSSHSIASRAPMSGLAVRRSRIPTRNKGLHRNMCSSTTSPPRRASALQLPAATADVARYCSFQPVSLSHSHAADSMLRLRGHRGRPLLQLHEVQPRLHLHARLCADTGFCSCTHRMARRWTAAPNVRRIWPAAPSCEPCGSIWSAAAAAASAGLSA
jgi:hypothetical protein